MERAVGYVRLSKEDFNKGVLDESESIINQRKFISDYAAEQGWELKKIYADEDISGSDRDRPEFNQMILDAYAGKFDIIVVKKQSRFARDLELVERYILNGFAEIGVRFVSILDNIDTAAFSSGMRKTSQLNGLIDQWYLEDLSENIKASFLAKAKRGESIASFPRFGYKKDPDKKGHLIPDPVAVKIVVQIFKWYASGYGEVKIANLLNERKIPSPYAYKKQNNSNVNLSKESSQSFYWRPGTIAQMLIDEIYIGSVVSGRFKKASYKSKKLLRRPPEEWIVIPNCHEPIIDKELWDRVQAIKASKSHKRSCADGKRSPLAGKVICGKCGGKMTRSGNKNVNVYFRCAQRGISADLCDGSYINEKKLQEALLQQLNELIQKYVNNEYQLDNINDEGKTFDEIQNEHLKELETEHLKLDKKRKMLYDDRLEGIITAAEYKEYKDSIDEKMKEISSKVTELQEMRLNKQKSYDSFAKKQEILSEYCNATAITADIADLFIDKIYIYDEGARQKRIEVKWRF